MVKQENKHNAQIGETFHFVNSDNFGFERTIVRMTEKSVFHTGGKTKKTVWRESWNTFNQLIEKHLVKRELDN